MRILLINPSMKRMLLTNVPDVIESGEGVIPPLGLLYIESYIKKKTNHEVRILDLELEKFSDQEFKEYLLDYNPEVVGLTTITFLMIRTKELIKIIRQTLPKTKIVLGGPHVHIYPQETLDNNLADFVVLGEGEKPFLDLLNNLDSKEILKDVKGLAFIKNGQYVNTGFRELVQNLDELPYPDRRTIKYKEYYSTLASENPTTSMFTSRGCPYKCIFCDRPHLGKNFRARSAENVVEEIEHIVNLGIKEIFIYDDTFTIQRERVVKICNLLLEKDIKIKWDIRARVNTVDMELLKLMKKAGCERIHYGVESGNDEILKNLRKGITVDMVRKAFKWTRQVGIETAAYMMIGSPGEKMEHINDSIKLTKQIKPDYAHISILTPFPATELYFIALQKGLIKEDVWREFAKNPTQNFVPPIWEENFTREELIKILKNFYRGFYLRPSYVIKRFFKLRSFDDFVNKAKVGLKMIRLKI